MHASNLQHLQHFLHHDIGFKMPFEMVTVEVAIDIILLVLNSFFIFPNQQFKHIEQKIWPPIYMT